MTSDAGIPQATVPPASRAGEPLHPFEALGAGWNSFASYPWMTIGAMLVLFVIMCVGSLIPFVNLLFAFLVAPALMAGGAWFLLQVVRGERPEFDSLFEGFRRWPSTTGAILLVYLGMFVCEIPMFVVMLATGGLMALAKPQDFVQHGFPGVFLALSIVTGVVTIPIIVWWGTRTMFVVFLVMEPDRPGAVEAFKRSWSITRGSVWRLVGLMLLWIPIGIIGLILLVVGLIPAYLTMYYSFAHAYERLRARAGLAPAVAPAGAPVAAPVPGH